MSYEPEKIGGVQEGEYKGRPILKLPLPSGIAFSFGIIKAKTILTYLEDIKKFIEQHETKNNKEVKKGGEL